MENIIANFREFFVDVAHDGYIKVMEILPGAFLAIITIAVGVFISAALYFLTIRLLSAFAIDKLAAKTPLQRFLRNIGIHRTISDIFALLVFWSGILITLVLAAERLEIPAVIAGPLSQVAKFVPRLISAFLITIFGMLLGKFLQTFTLRTLKSAQVSFAQSMSRAVYILVVVYMTYLALDLLFDLTAITLFFTETIRTILFVAIIAILFVSRHMLEDAVACLHVRQLVSIGQHIRIDATEGKVAGFTMTGIIIDAAAEQVVVPAADFFRKTYSVSKSHE